MSDKMWDILRFLKPSQEDELKNALNNKEKMRMDSQLLKGIESQIEEVERAEKGEPLSLDEMLFSSTEEPEAKVIPIPEEEYSAVLLEEQTPQAHEPVSSDSSEPEVDGERAVLEEIAEESFTPSQTDTIREQDLQKEESLLVALAEPDDPSPAAEEEEVEETVDALPSEETDGVEEVSLQAQPEEGTQGDFPEPELQALPESSAVEESVEIPIDPPISEDPLAASLTPEADPVPEEPKVTPSLSIEQELQLLTGTFTADELPTEESAGRGRELKEIPLGEIVPNPYQPRLIMVEEDISELAESIREVGVLQPILVRRAENGYELIAGERRFRAAKEIGLSSIPALVAEVEPLEQQLIALVENLQRKNLSAVEEGRCLQDILSRTAWSQTELAKRLGRSQAAVANKIRLLRLDETVQRWVMEGKLGERQARTLLSFAPDEQLELGKQAIDEELSVKALEAIAASRLAQKPQKSGKRATKAPKKKVASDRELLQDVAELVALHRDRGTAAEWKVCEMTEKSILIEIRVDLTQHADQNKNGQVS